MTHHKNPRNIYLSHLIGPDTPMYGDDGAFIRQTLKSVERGDTANTERWSLNNHTGTHIDFPRHFYHEGKVLNDFPADFFILDKIAWIDLSEICRPGIILEKKHFKNVLINEETEILLLKTGFETIRGDAVYWKQNPGFSEELANYFRSQCPQLRFFGFDSISLTSFENRMIGRAAHRAFLGGENPILIIEDMRLTDLEAGMTLTKLVIAPLLVDQADGTPVTVFATIYN